MRTAIRAGAALIPATRSSAVAFATGRPNARIQGASEDTVKERVKRLRG
jgi:hypothetical protein